MSEKNQGVELEEMLDELIGLQTKRLGSTGCFWEAQAEMKKLKQFIIKKYPRPEPDESVELHEAQARIKELEAQYKLDGIWRGLAASEVEELKKELAELEGKMSGLYVRKDCVEGELGQYLGVYMLQWKPEWGKPTEIFIEYEPPNTKPGKEGK